MKSGLEQWELSPESKGWLWHTPLYETWVPERFEKTFEFVWYPVQIKDKKPNNPIPQLADSA